MTIPSYLAFDPGVVTRQCNRCQSLKPIKEFYKNRPSRGGYLNQCKTCVNKKNKEYKLKAKQNKEKWRTSIYATELRKYNLTINEYEFLLEKQHSVCAICECEPFFKRLSVDHNHATGKVRGLICNDCNLMLGNAFDDPSILLAGADYLKERNG